MKKEPFVVAIGGVFSVGKDTLCSLLRRQLYLDYGLKTERVAFADPLKEECQQIILDKYNIDILNCSLEDKNRCRHILVEYAAAKREQSKGTYWVNKAEEKIQNLDVDVVIISDLRFNEYPNDETYYVKYFRNGLLIHLSKYSIEESLDKLKFIKYSPPANETEAVNDPKVKEAADIIVQWGHGKQDHSLVEYITNQIYTRYLIK